jgi:UDP-N-acetyl-D-galactosamine dehydrogenase
MLPTLAGLRVSVIGLGYVGLPLAVHFARKYPVVGFDISAARIAELKRGIDHTREVGREEMAAAAGRLRFSSDPGELAGSNFHIVTVPTPIDAARRPDLGPLMAASETVGRVLRQGSVVVFESTVYPGATEEVCVPIIEKASGLKLNQGFFAGYSPERINPGDQRRRLPDILKITSGSSPEAADLIDRAYASIIPAGTHKVSSIRVAEAAKVIENTQRDLNIALINEFSQLFNRMGLETREVLEAAGTKWNFHPYQPGLVGGHCIGVDPYYLTHKAQSIGFHPEMILAGRRINDGMARFVAHDVIKALVKRGIRLDTARILVMGFTFKENCPDTRNTKVADLVAELSEFVATVTIHDPLADPGEVEREYGLRLSNDVPAGPFEAIVLAVAHEAIASMGSRRLRQLLAAGGVLYDMKSILPAADSDARL